MTHSDIRPPGNKNVPAPRPGYEQRKVAHRKYSDAVTKGWNERQDEGSITYNGRDYILCEREIESPKENLILINYFIPDYEEMIEQLSDQYYNPIFGTKIILKSNNTFILKEFNDTPEKIL